MATRIHYYGSTFELADNYDGSQWRTIIQSYFDQAASAGTPVGAWFDLQGGGHVSFWLHADTPLAVASD